MRIEKRLVLKRSVKVFFSRLLIMIIIILIGLITIKKNPSYKDVLKKKIYEEIFHFQKIDKIYQKVFGNIFSLKKSNSIIKPVLNEKLKYKKIEDYGDGVKLSVDDNFSVSLINSGVIIYIGEIDSLGYSVVVEGGDGVDYIYSNISLNNYKLYDYVEKGEILGNVKGDYLVLSFKKDGEYLNYKEYI